MEVSATHANVADYIADVQTIQSLHSVGTLCHLDVSSSNIMLRSDNFKPWDQLRLIDFGFAQKLRSAGKTAM